MHFKAGGNLGIFGGREKFSKGKTDLGGNYVFKTNKYVGTSPKYALHIVLLYTKSTIVLSLR